MFRRLRRARAHPGEAAANMIRVNDHVLMRTGFPRPSTASRQRLRRDHRSSRRSSPHRRRLVLHVAALCPLTGSAGQARTRAVVRRASASSRIGPSRSGVGWLRGPIRRKAGRGVHRRIPGGRQTPSSGLGPAGHDSIAPSNSRPSRSQTRARTPAGSSSKRRESITTVSRRRSARHRATRPVRRDRCRQPQSGS